MSVNLDKWTTQASLIWADWSDGWEDNPRAMVIQFVLGLAVCALGVLVF